MQVTGQYVANNVNVINKQCFNVILDVVYKMSVNYAV